MDIKESVLLAFENVLELERSELLDNLDYDLLENGIIDSLVMVTLISEIENNLDKKIEIRKFGAHDFSTINQLLKAIASQF